MHWFIIVLVASFCLIQAVLYARCRMQGTIITDHPAAAFGELVCSWTFLGVFVEYSFGHYLGLLWNITMVPYFFGMSIILSLLLFMYIESVYERVCGGRPDVDSSGPSASAWMSCLAGTILGQCLTTAFTWLMFYISKDVYLSVQASGTLAVLFAVSSALMVPWHLEFVMWQWTPNIRRESWLLKAILSLLLVLSPVAFTAWIARTATSMTQPMVGQQIVFLCTRLFGCFGTRSSRVKAGLLPCKEAVLVLLIGEVLASFGLFIFGWVTLASYAWVDCVSLLGTLSSLTRSMYRAPAETCARTAAIFTLLQTLAFTIAVQVNLSLLVVPDPVPHGWKQGMMAFKVLGMLATLVSWVVEWRL